MCYWHQHYLQILQILLISLRAVYSNIELTELYCSKDFRVNNPVVKELRDPYHNPGKYAMHIMHC